MNGHNPNSVPFLGHLVLPPNMRKALALLLAILLLPSAPSAFASTTLLEVGVVESVEGRLVHISFSSESTLMTLSTDGNLSEFFWGDGELIHQYSVELNITAKSATPDSTGLQVAIAHTEGVMIFNTELRIPTKTYNISSTIDSVVWDTEGDLWFGQNGGERRAKEYGDTEWTGVATVSHNTGMTAMTIISDDRIVTGGRDNLVKVFAQDGTLLQSLSDYSSHPSVLVRDSNGMLLVGTANGQVIRYDVTTWDMESMVISSGDNVNSISFDSNGDLLVGTLNGKLHIVDGSTFNETEEYDAAGRVLLGFFGPNEELFVVSAFTTSTKFRLFDLDTDGDGVTDSQDAFPTDSSQDTDSDGDGYGDDSSGNMSDAFPDDETQWSDVDGDGHGDNPDGTSSDAFPNNADQWQDSDGDGWGDNTNGEGGDRYPDDGTQWADSDFDGFGDEVNGTNGDECPTVNGFSTEDRLGCKDSDSDGWSDEDDMWSLVDGADAFETDPTQWKDIDGDGYGDNQLGNTPDSCPTIWGNSTKAWLPSSSDLDNVTFEFEVLEKFGCQDTDGDEFWDYGDDLENDPNDYRDDDGDGAGFSRDYDDSNPLVITLEEHCLIDVSDTREDCLGYRDSEYMSYKNEKEAAGQPVLDYYPWNNSKNSDDQNVGNSVDMSIVGDVAKFGGGAFAIVLLVILLFVGVTRARRRKALVKTYGVPYVPDTKSAEAEALGGQAGLSAHGGVESDKHWDDEIEPMELVHEPAEDMSEGFDDLDIKNDVVSTDDSGILEESSSLEELAGMPEPSQESAEAIGDIEVAMAVPEAPPLPAEGLPEGWTMEQWKWYGAQWLESQGK